VNRFELDTEVNNAQLNDNLETLAANEYIGRFFAMGVSQSGETALQVYAITGRSESSRDRTLEDDGDGLKVIAPGKTAEEMAKVENAALIYYRAMQERGGIHVVSNGAQTEPVIWNLLRTDDITLEDAMSQAPFVGKIDLSKYEPDTPNFTPRIVGALDFRFPDRYSRLRIGHVYRDAANLEWLNANQDTKDIVRPVYKTYGCAIRDVQPGTAFAIQTYAKDAPAGVPLPSYTEKPYAIPVLEDAGSTLAMLWGTFHRKNLVAAAVKEISLATGETESIQILGKLATEESINA
jgi:IMP cyclohydrolase